jgi:serine/threonine-protein kinase RsbW
MGAPVRGQSEAVEIPGAAGTDDLVLDIPPQAEHARTARLFAAAAARHFEVDEERVDDLKIAISEACTNAIKANAAAGVDDTIRVVAHAEPGGIRFSVTDAGAGFDPDSAIRSAEGYTPPSGLNEGTLGLALISSLFPTMDISRNHDRGMTVSILVER